jgi:hypothetical protein
VSNNDAVTEGRLQLSSKPTSETVPAPDLPYKRVTANVPPKIGLIAAGALPPRIFARTKKRGTTLRSCATCPSRRRKTRNEFFPDAAVTADYRAVLGRKTSPWWTSPPTRRSACH